jgi:dolichyl-phosphate beta-glucosyltransferase
MYELEIQIGNSNLHPVDLSIVIPAYNEERRLPKTLDRISAFFKASPFRAEIIVVDDGSTDATAQLVASF